MAIIEAEPSVTTRTGSSILNPGFDLTLRPMKYPQFFKMYENSIKNTWTVEEVNLSDDKTDLERKLTESEQHLIKRLVAFFATGDSIVSNNLVLNLYKHINSPEARMYLSRQLFEEAVHIQFYLQILDTYLDEESDRNDAFQAIENIPSIRKKGEFCFKWIGSINDLDSLETREDRQKFLLNLICFASCIEGLFFFGAFAYVYFLRSKGLLNGLADGTNWVFRDESMHMQFAFEVIQVILQEEPDLFDEDLKTQVREMIKEAVECESQFAQDILDQGVQGLSLDEVNQYLQCVADDRLVTLGLAPEWNVKNPLGFMKLQDVQEVTNFFERTVSAYQTGVTGEVSFDSDF